MNDLKEATVSAPRRRRSPPPKKKIPTVAGILAAICVIAAVILFLKPQPTFITGVQESLELIEGENPSDALLAGVTCAQEDGQNAVPVSVTILDEKGEAVALPAAGTYRLVYSAKHAEDVESTLVILPPDTEPPVIEGAKDITVPVGGVPSYRSGVTATDKVDGSVKLSIDASQVDPAEPGTYTVTYSATDKAGNTGTCTVTVNVIPPEEVPETEEGSNPVQITMDTLNALCDKVLAKITNSGMGTRDKARAIFDYVHSRIRYVGTSDKSSWIKGAYVGMTQGKGDCFNYFAASKALLTRAGIPNVDLSRVGGTTDHYWQLVDVGSGYYHFDACPHPNGYGIISFMLTESEVRAYSEKAKPVRLNYYIYDYDSCPVTPVYGEGAPAPTETPKPVPAEKPTQAPAPTDAPAEAPAETAVPAPTQAPAQDSDEPLLPPESMVSPN